MSLIPYEPDHRGFEDLYEKRVMIFCNSYIYTGIVIGVNKTCVLLDEAAVVYETGSFTSRIFHDAQSLPFPLYIQISSVESFSETDKRK